MGRCLPKERSKVVIIRTLSATLEVDKVGIAIAVKHDVACLKVAIEEALTALGCQVLGKHTEIGLKFQLMKIKSSGLQEAIFKVIEVEQHAFLIKFRLRITVVPVESTCAAHLEIGQFPNCRNKKLLLFLVVTATRFTPSADGIIQRRVPQVGLKVTQLIVAHRQDTRNRQPAQHEMAVEIDKSMVLVAARSNHTDDAFTVVSHETEVLPIAARTRNLCYRSRFLTRVAHVKCRQLLHDYLYLFLFFRLFSHCTNSASMSSSIIMMPKDMKNDRVT